MTPNIFLLVFLSVFHVPTIFALYGVMYAMVLYDRHYNNELILYNDEDKYRELILKRVKMRKNVSARPRVQS